MNIPKSLQFHFGDAGVKASWPIIFPMQTAFACENCGGTEIVMVFCATGGPFQTPANPYLLDEKGKPLSSKFIDGKWWVGHAYSAPCPECQNDKPQGQVSLPTEIAKDSDVTDAVESVIDRMQKKRKDIYG